MRVRRRSTPFLVAALTILGLLTSAPDATAAGKKSPMIVVLDRDADVDAVVKRDKREHGVKPTNVFKYAARGYAAELTPGQARAIERDRSVLGVIPDSVVELVAQVTPPGVRRVRPTFDVAGRDQLIDKGAGGLLGHLRLLSQLGEPGAVRTDPLHDPCLRQRDRVSRVQNGCQHATLDRSVGDEHQRRHVEIGHRTP